MEQKKKLFDEENEQELLRKTNFLSRNFSFQKLSKNEMRLNCITEETPERRLIQIVQ